MAKRGLSVDVVVPGALVLVAVLFVAPILRRYAEGFQGSVTASLPMYDNSKIYQPGAIVTFDTEVYQMVEGAGAPGYAPNRPGDKLWRKLYDNQKIYTVGDRIVFKGQEYEMVEGAGAPGYAPDRPGDKLWAQPYNNGKVYNVGDKIAFEGRRYVMVEGAGAPGYAPNRPGDQLWRPF